MKEIPISQFKAQCLSILAGMQKTLEPIQITKHGEPLAVIYPVLQGVIEDRKAGSMKSHTVINDDLLKPLDIEWEALK